MKVGKIDLNESDKISIMFEIIVANQNKIELLNIKVKALLEEIETLKKKILELS